MSVNWLIIIIVVSIMILTMTSLYGKKYSRLGEIDKDYYRDRLKSIFELATDEDGMKLAIIEADKLLEHALKECQYIGTTLSERLISAKKSLTRRDAVWTAHRIRNQVVHQEGFKINDKLTKQSLRAYTIALKDLGVL